MSYFLSRSRYGSGYGRRVSTVELFVPMCCTKCEEKITENMLELDGVQRVFVDLSLQRVTVTGFVDPMRALKMAKKVKKDSTFLPGTGQVGFGGNYSKPYAYDDLAYRTSRYEYNPSGYRSSYNARPYAYDDLAYRTSRYEYSPSVYRSSYNQYMPSGYRSSYNQYAPSYGHSYRQRGSQMYNEWPMYDDISNHVITNPRYVKHIESEY